MTSMMLRTRASANQVASKQKVCHDCQQPAPDSTRFRNDRIRCSDCEKKQKKKVAKVNQTRSTEATKTRIAHREWKAEGGAVAPNIRCYALSEAYRVAMHKLLTRVICALEDWEVPHCAAFGTLLGVVRNGELLHHDDDIDVGTAAILQEKDDLLRAKYKLRVWADPDWKENWSLTDVKNQADQWPFVEGFPIDRAGNIIPDAKSEAKDKYTKNNLKVNFTNTTTQQISVKGHKVAIQIPANSALLLDVMYPDWKERISGLDYQKMGRRDLIENAEQAAFDAASGDLLSHPKKKQKKIAHKSYTETATAK